MSALQQLSRDRDHGSVLKAPEEQTQKPGIVQGETTEEFEHRHGTGYTLTRNGCSGSSG